jgi:hypothetical protein
MKAQTKIRVLIFSFVLPYTALVMYLAYRRPESSPFPYWYAYFGLSYLLLTMTIVVLYGRRIYQGVAPAPGPPSVARRLFRAHMAYLVTLWSMAFLWGAYKTVKGDLAWQRSVPAGFFLLLFIALFSWALYKDLKAQGQATTTTTAKDPRDWRAG